jgi:hypothetical protein
MGQGINDGGGPARCNTEGVGEVSKALHDLGIDGFRERDS